MEQLSIYNSSRRPRIGASERAEGHIAKLIEYQTPLYVNPESREVFATIRGRSETHDTGRLDTFYLYYRGNTRETLFSDLIKKLNELENRGEWSFQVLDADPEYRLPWLFTPENTDYDLRPPQQYDSLLKKKYKLVFESVLEDVQEQSTYLDIAANSFQSLTSVIQEIVRGDKLPTLPIYVSMSGGYSFFDDNSIIFQVNQERSAPVSPNDDHSSSLFQKANDRFEKDQRTRIFENIQDQINRLIKNRSQKVTQSELRSMANFAQQEGEIRIDLQTEEAKDCLAILKDLFTNPQEDEDISLLSSDAQRELRNQVSTYLIETRENQEARIEKSLRKRFNEIVDKLTTDQSYDQEEIWQGLTTMEQKLNTWEHPAGRKASKISPDPVRDFVDVIQDLHRYTDIDKQDIVADIEKRIKHEKEEVRNTEYSELQEKLQDNVSQLENEEMDAETAAARIRRAKDALDFRKSISPGARKDSVIESLNDISQRIETSKILDKSEREKLVKNEIQRLNDLEQEYRENKHQELQRQLNSTIDRLRPASDTIEDLKKANERVTSAQQLFNESGKNRHLKSDTLKDFADLLKEVQTSSILEKPDQGQSDKLKNKIRNDARGRLNEIRNEIRSEFEKQLRQRLLGSEQSESLIESDPLVERLKPDNESLIAYREGGRRIKRALDLLENPGSKQKKDQELLSEFANLIELAQDTSILGQNEEIHTDKRNAEIVEDVRSEIQNIQQITQENYIERIKRKFTTQLSGQFSTDTTSDAYSQFSELNTLKTSLSNRHDNSKPEIKSSLSKLVDTIHDREDPLIDSNSRGNLQSELSEKILDIQSEIIGNLLSDLEENQKTAIERISDAHDEPSAEVEQLEALKEFLDDITSARKSDSPSLMVAESIISGLELESIGEQLHKIFFNYPKFRSNITEGISNISDGVTDVINDKYQENAASTGKRVDSELNRVLKSVNQSSPYTELKKYQTGLERLQEWVSSGGKETFGIPSRFEDEILPILDHAIGDDPRPEVSGEVTQVIANKRKDIIEIHEQKLRTTLEKKLDRSPDKRDKNPESQDNEESKIQTLQELYWDLTWYHDVLSGNKQKPDDVKIEKKRFYEGINSLPQQESEGLRDDYLDQFNQERQHIKADIEEAYVDSINNLIDRYVDHAKETKPQDTVSETIEYKLNDELKPFIKGNENKISNTHRYINDAISLYSDVIDSEILHDDSKDRVQQSVIAKIDSHLESSISSTVKSKLADFGKLIPSLSTSSAESSNNNSGLPYLRIALVVGGLVFASLLVLYIGIPGDPLFGGSGASTASPGFSNLVVNGNNSETSTNIIEINGSVNGAQMVFARLNSGSENIYSRNLTVQDSGKFSGSFEVRESGIYTISLSSEDIEDTISFTIPLVGGFPSSNTSIVSPSWNESITGSSIQIQANIGAPTYRMQIHDQLGNLINSTSGTSRNGSINQELQVTSPGQYFVSVTSAGVTDIVTFHIDDSTNQTATASNSET